MTTRECPPQKTRLGIDYNALSRVNLKEVYEDEHVRHLGMARPVTHHALGEILLQAPPVTLSRTPGSVRQPAPDAGQHTDEILGELGYSSAEIAALHTGASVSGAVPRGSSFLPTADLCLVLDQSG